MTVEELEKQLKTFQSDFDQTKKDFELKLGTAKKEADDWRQVAQKKEEEAKKFQEEAEKAEKERKKAEAEARKTEHKAFVDRMKAEGKLVPAQEEASLKLMESLSAEGEIAKFTAKDGSSRSHSQLSLFKEMVENSPKRVSFGYSTRKQGEHSPQLPGEGKAEGGEGQIEILHQGKRTMIPLVGADMAARAFEYQAEVRKTQGREIDYGEALIAVEKMERAA